MGRASPGETVWHYGSRWISTGALSIHTRSRWRSGTFLQLHYLIELAEREWADPAYGRKAVQLLEAGDCCLAHRHNATHDSLELIEVRRDEREG
jgi:cytosine/adenosine deaminase-related metal-dependent hydrolase